MENVTMKTEYSKKWDGLVMVPETSIEAVELLEEFLIADFGQKDWSVDFLKRHFKICKDHIHRIMNKKVKQ